MKFKRLPLAELQKLEKEFVQFLASNTITADDWQKLQKDSPAKANELVDMFSDIVYQKVMEKIQYIEFRTSHEMKQFKCGKEQFEMIGLTVMPEVPVDLRKGEDLAKLNDYADQISIFHGTKNYDPNREEEIFKMMDAGAMKTDGRLYGLLDKLYSKNKD